ncbi:MAG: helix-turn-helix domain-containing protein [Chloroflexi bacterium]|nr:helix-turn-helix domain-containing protein [Chloroflexota bacterium]
MITEQILSQARAAARSLKADGKVAEAQAVEDLIAETADAALPQLDLLTTGQAGELLGVTGQTIKNWVRGGKLDGYRVGGRIMISRQAMEAYVRRARTSFDLPDLTDDEIVQLIDDDRAPDPDQPAGR